MRLSLVTAGVSLVAVAACAGDTATTPCCSTATPSLRVINAIKSPVDVLIDGSVAIPSLTPGDVGTTAAVSGVHSLTLRPTQSGASSTLTITTATGAISTIAAVLGPNGVLQTAVLDDTNSVVPDGRTKVRVLHLAPSAGTLQVYRTQPDYQQPIAWQFPFNYQSNPTSLTAPFVQSTVGTWEIRVWETPADSTGWANAPIKIQIPLASGEKKTVILLDKTGGGIRYELM